MSTENSPIDCSSKSQKYLGEKGLIILIAFLNAFIPLSTDLYLPALPRMAENFASTPSLVNLTLTLFFIFYAAGTLFWGPLSDKYGRKRILLTGLVIYTAASALCALSVNVYQLIGFRILQAIASGAVTSVGSAVVKDVYTRRKRESVLALVSSMVMIAPIVAPVVGALILNFTSWRGVFWALSGIGLFAIVGGIAMEETIDKCYKGNILQSIGRLGVVIKNPGFAALLITFSIMAIPMMSFILAGSVTRPPSAHLMLEQQQEDTGSAASLMTFSFTLMGSIGMMLISLNWANRILVMGLLYFIIGLLSLILWLVVSKKSYIRQVQ